MIGSQDFCVSFRNTPIESKMLLTEMLHTIYDPFRPGAALLIFILKRLNRRPMAMAKIGKRKK